MVTDAVGTIQVWSDAAHQLYGWPERDVLGLPVAEVLGPPDPPVDGPAVLEALRSGGEVRSERTVRHRDGRVLHVFTIVRALLGEDGTVQYVVGATDDLAEIAALEIEAKELADHLRLALDAGGFGTWRWDIASGVTTWDPEMERLFGLAPGTFDGTFDAWTALLHPDDADEVLRVVGEAVAAKTRYRLEHRVITPAGEVRWIEGAGQVTLDAEGVVTGTIGCSHDIAERALAEQERKRLSKVAVESLARERVQRERLELVAAVNAALDGADDLPTLMARVTHAVVPQLGDWCTLHVLESETARVPLVEIAHHDPAMVRYARELQARYPFDPDAPSGVAAVIRTGQPEFFPLIDEAMIAASGATPEQQQILRDLGLRSAITVPLAKRGRALGAMQFVMSDGHRPYTEEDLTLVTAVAARIAATLDNRRLRGQRDRTARTDAALANLGRRLAAASTLDQVLAVIAQDAPVVLGATRAEVGLALDAASITVMGRPGRRVPLDDAGPLAAALLQTETVLHEGEIAFGVDRPDGTIGAIVASPIYDDVHQPMGVLVLTWDEPTTLDEVDLNAIETLSRLCGQSIVRSQLAGHTQELAALAAAMAGARTTSEIARLLREHGAAHLRTVLTDLRLIDRESATLVTVLPDPVHRSVLEHLDRVPLRSPMPLTDAFRDQRAVWITDLDDYRRRFPDTAAEAADVGLGAVAVLPLADSDGEAIGAVVFGWPHAMRFDHRLRSRLTTLAGLAAQTLERVRLYEAEHAVIASLQHRLLAPLPAVDGLEMASYYEPAAAAVGMGGDWYEAVVLADGSVVVIIGDVVGHGVDAVAAMAQIQHLLTGLLRAGTPLGEVLALANAMITGPDRTFATALLLHVDVERGRVGYRSAGHPWALVRHPDGVVSKLDANQHPMFGMAVEAGDLVYAPLPPGAVVLAYTDGLVERRDEGIDVSVERLAARLASSPAGDLDRALHRLVDEVRALDPDRRPTTDDVAAVLIRRR